MHYHSEELIEHLNEALGCKNADKVQKKKQKQQKKNKINRNMKKATL